MTSLGNIGANSIRRLFLIGMLLMVVSSVMATFTISTVTQTGVTGNIITTTCQLYNTIHTVILFLGLALIILGAALYAGSHVLPGNLKSNAQGYGMGMIVGGVVGVILALSAPFILQVITGNSTQAASCNGYSSF